MDVAPIISVLLKQAPYLMFSLLGLGMVLIGSTGKFIKAEIDSKDRPILKKTGWGIFWLFLIAALFEVVLPGKLKDFISFLLSPSTLWRMVGLGICILFVYLGVVYIKKVRVEKGYRVETDKILDEPFDCGGETLYKTAGILVENSGIAEIRCVAKLSKVMKFTKEENKIDTIPIKIKKLNPNGLNLRWDDGLGACTIKKQRPRRIDLVNSYEDYKNYFRKGRLCFENGYTSPLETGAYLIEIDIFRISGNNQIKINTVQGVLGISIYYKSLPSPVSGDGISVIWHEED
jgi:hypothetical protein